MIKTVVTVDEDGATIDLGTHVFTITPDNEGAALLYYRGALHVSSLAKIEEVLAEHKTPPLSVDDE